MYCDFLDNVILFSFFNAKTMRRPLDPSYISPFAKGRRNVVNFCFCSKAVFGSLNK